MRPCLSGRGDMHTLGLGGCILGAGERERERERERAIREVDIFIIISICIMSPSPATPHNLVAGQHSRGPGIQDYTDDEKKISPKCFLFFSSPV